MRGAEESRHEKPTLGQRDAAATALGLTALMLDPGHLSTASAGLAEAARVCKQMIPPELSPAAPPIAHQCRLPSPAEGRSRLLRTFGFASHSPAMECGPGQATGSWVPRLPGEMTPFTLTSPFYLRALQLLVRKAQRTHFLSELED